MKVFLIIIGIALAFFAGIYFSQKYNLKVEPKIVSQSPTIIETKTISPTETITQEVITSPTISEEDLKMVIGQLLVDKHGDSAGNLTITISKQTDDFARGGASGNGGGGMWLAYKVNGSWKLAFDGNGVADCLMLKTTYKFPADMLVGVCD